MQFHHHGYVSGDPRVQPAAGVGLDRPDAGRVLFGGDDVTGVGPERRGVAWVPQRPALYPHLSVWQNVAVGLRLREPWWRRWRRTRRRSPRRRRR